MDKPLAWELSGFSHTQLENKWFKCLLRRGVNAFVKINEKLYEFTHFLLIFLSEAMKIQKHKCMNFFWGFFFSSVFSGRASQSEYKAAKKLGNIYKPFGEHV